MDETLILILDQHETLLFELLMLQPVFPPESFCLRVMLISVEAALLCSQAIMHKLQHAAILSTGCTSNLERLSVHGIGLQNCLAYTLHIKSWPRMLLMKPICIRPLMCNSTMRAALCSSFVSRCQRQSACQQPGKTGISVIHSSLMLHNLLSEPVRTAQTHRQDKGTKGH